MFFRGGPTAFGSAPAPSQPAWLAGIAVGQYVEIAGSSLSLLGASMAAPNGGSGASSKQDSWCGWARNGSKLYGAWNGGHNDYWGNEVESIDLSQDAPAWARLEASSLSAAAQTAAEYTDGRPVSCHSYGTLHYNATDNRIIRVGSTAASKTGTTFDNCPAFDVTNGVTLASGTVPNLPVHPIATGYSAWRDNADNLYLFTTRSVYKYTRATNTWGVSAVATNATQGGFECSAALDTLRNRVLIAGGETADKPFLFDVAGSSLSAVVFGGSAPTALNILSPGLTYCADIDLFLGRGPGAGGTTYSVHPTTFAIEPYSTTGGASINVAANDVCARFHYLPALKGVVYGPKSADNLWFLRTS